MSESILAYFSKDLGGERDKIITNGIYKCMTKKSLTNNFGMDRIVSDLKVFLNKDYNLGGIVETNIKYILSKYGTGEDKDTYAPAGLEQAHEKKLTA